MTATAARPEGRPRRWWAAFLLNLLLPPAGYAYAGSWMAAAMAFLLIILGPVAAMQVTAAYPPGVYALGLSGMAVLGAIAALGLAAHAAVLAARAPPKPGNQLAHVMLYALTWIVAFGANAALRAYWPNPTYEVASASMAPTLQPGDVVLVDGARARCGDRKLKPGQVVLFRRPGEAAPYLHRIVAGPGQTVSMTAGRLRIDGAPVAQSAVGSVRLPGLPTPAALVQETLPNGVTYRVADLTRDADGDDKPPVQTPRGSWYLLGDSRDNANDSRFRGPVPARDICAVAQKILASRDMRRVGQLL